MMSSVVGLGGRSAAGTMTDRSNARLGRGVAQDLVVQAVLDEQVGADPEQDRGQRHERDERDRQPRPDPAQGRASAQRTAL